MSSLSVFTDLISSFPTWESLSAHLKSREGGALRIDDNSTPENPFAVIRYVKGQSNMDMPHVRTFRSVVWDTLEHRPVSVCPVKSEDGESVPADAGESTDGFVMTHFVDGVMIGMFYDNYSGQWRIHTRSTLDATCRYFSNAHTFQEMFTTASGTLDYDALDKTCCYTWVLTHPENRIVVSVNRPRITCVQKGKYTADGGFTVLPLEGTQYAVLTIRGMKTWAEVKARISEWNVRFKHNAQGIVMQELATGRRWKLRTAEYNRVRLLRGNSPRRDYLMMDCWRRGLLRDYITFYPEERVIADALLARWKHITNDVYRMYVEVFKARKMDKSAIPPKYRPLVFGLHGKYLETLKPAGKSVDWKAAQDFMNERDTAQMLFVLNWEVRQAAREMGAILIPIEPPVSMPATETKDDDTA